MAEHVLGGTPVIFKERAFVFPSKVNPLLRKSSEAEDRVAEAARSFGPSSVIRGRAELFRGGSMGLGLGNTGRD